MVIRIILREWRKYLWSNSTCWCKRPSEIFWFDSKHGHWIVPIYLQIGNYYCLKQYRLVMTTENENFTIKWFLIVFQHLVVYYILFYYYCRLVAMHFFLPLFLLRPVIRSVPFYTFLWVDFKNYHLHPNIFQVWKKLDRNGPSSETKPLSTGLVFAADNDF